METERQIIYTPYEVADIIEIPIGTVVDDLPSLENLVEFFRISELEENSQPWRKGSKDDFVKMLDDIRGGFIGTVIPKTLELIDHGQIKDSSSDTELSNAWVFKIEMEFMKTSRKNIIVSGGIIVGSGYKRISIKALDLATGKFGKVIYPEIEEYLARSKAAGINTLGGVATKSYIGSDRTGSIT